MDFKSLLMEKSQRLRSEIKSLSPLKKVSVIFVALLLFIIIIERPGAESLPSKTFIPYFKSQNIRKIAINLPEGNDHSLKIEKKENIWWVVNGHAFPADETAVNELLNAIAHLKEENIASKNPQRMTLFEVDQKQGIQVILRDKKDREIANFYAGKSNPLNQQYVRRNDTNEVIEISGNINPLIKKDIEAWKDKTILKINEEEVSRLAINRKNDEVIIEKKDEKWILPQHNSKVADNLAIRTLFEQLKQVRAAQFADPTEGSQVNFDQPDYKLSVRQKNNELSVVLFKQKDEKNYYVKTGQSTFVYIAPKNLADQLFELNLTGEKL